MMTILTSLRSLRGLSLVLTAAVFMLFAGSAAPHVAAGCGPLSDLPGACEEPAPPPPAKNDDICFTTNATVAEKDGKLSVYYLTTSTDNITTLIMEINLSSLTLTTYANGIAAWVGQSKITGLTSWWVMISKDTKITDSSYVVTVGQNMTVTDGKATSSVETVTGCNLATTPTITPLPVVSESSSAVATEGICSVANGANGIVVAYDKDANAIHVYRMKDDGSKGDLLTTFAAKSAKGTPTTIGMEEPEYAPFFNALKIDQSGQFGQAAAKITKVENAGYVGIYALNSSNLKQGGPFGIFYDSNPSAGFSKSIDEETIKAIETSTSLTATGYTCNIPAS